MKKDCSQNFVSFWPIVNDVYGVFYVSLNKVSSVRYGF